MQAAALPPGMPVCGAGPPALRVMVVDDSAVVRAALTRMLEADPAIRVAAQAADGWEALRQAALVQAGRQRLDLVLLDVEMPGLDGLGTLPRLLRAAPGVAVVMASALTTHGAEVTLQALRLGAADYVAKPAADRLERGEFGRELLAKVHALAARRIGAAPPRVAWPVAAPAAPGGPPPLLVAVGSSTGGPQALFTLVAGLGRDLPVPVVVAQHMPATFTAILASHLDRLGLLACREAQDGEALRPGHLYLATGGRHLLVERDGGALRARLSDAPAEHYCRPSVDVLLRSAARACAGRVLAVLLTGMGQDGLAGTRAVVAAGGAAIAQDEATSVVWGMPGAVARAGLCRAVLPLGEIAAAVRHATRHATRHAAGVP